MSMVIFAISYLTTSSLPCWAFQVPVQSCSLRPQTLLPSPVTSTAGHCVCFGIRLWLFLLSAVLVAFFHQWLSPDGTTVIQIMLRVSPPVTHPLPATPRNPSRSAHIPPPLGRLPYTWALIWIFSSPDCLWCLQLECLICPLSITHLMSLKCSLSS